MFSDFCNARNNDAVDDFIVLLVDAEDPVDPQEIASNHLVQSNMNALTLQWFSPVVAVPELLTEAMMARKTERPAVDVAHSCEVADGADT